MSFDPDSTSCRTRCEPRNPVPPVIRVVAGTFLTMAACRFVLFFGTIWAVRFFGVLVGMDRLTTEDTEENQIDNLNFSQSGHFCHCLVLLCVLCGETILRL